MWLFFFSFTLLSWDRKAGGAQVQGISVPPLFMFPRLLLNKRALCSRAIGGWGYLQAVTQFIHGSAPIRRPFKAFKVCLAFKTKQTIKQCHSKYAACKKKQNQTLEWKHGCKSRNPYFPCLHFLATFMRNKLQILQEHTLKEKHNIIIFKLKWKHYAATCTYKKAKCDVYYIQSNRKSRYFVSCHD